VGDTVICGPLGVSAQVLSIERNHLSIDKAVPGDIVGIALKGLQYKDVKRGYVIGNTRHPPREIESFTAQIRVIHTSGIRVGYTPVIHCHTASIACRMETIQLTDKYGKVIDNPQLLKSGDTAFVKFVPKAPMCVEMY
jgi:elongation factor 1-alpha